MNATCPVGDIIIGAGRPLTIIGGPCLLESESLAMEVGVALRDACRAAGLQYIFKASFDKANRSSIASARGPGLADGVAMLGALRERLGVPVTTDIHEPAQAPSIAEAVDLIQIPAFLCRQTDLLIGAGQAAAAHGRAVNVKKGQFLSPREMGGACRKLLESGCERIILTERGTFFGYHRLVNDFLGFGDLMELQIEGAGPAGGQMAGPWPVCFDCTHSTQLPGAGETTGGRPERSSLLARAAVAAGAHAVFMECHPDPASAHSDASTMLPLKQALALVETLARVRRAVAMEA
ncbi:MAG: 3-deoxy-8-phosphooctulonate synthase [Phycisphaeraceae bacterium]|nr:MAG: 3-deoxy-8-phosphooctulonate synthase [Phycisphaeraceae bacterium]